MNTHYIFNTNFLITSLLLIIVIWSLIGYFSSRVETAKYTVLESKNNYEVRLYPAHIVAQTTVSGSYAEGMRSGFRIVAAYIFGGNIKKQNISMTSPVTIDTKTSESIAMTSPVIVDTKNNTQTISFGMPSSYTLDTLPTPSDPRVKIVELKEMKMAVLRFTLWRTDSRVQDKKKELIDALANDKIEILGEPSYAGYSAPWTPPWMTRNEVMVEIR